MARPVLVFNAVPHVAVAVARSLQRQGIPVTFAHVDSGATPPSRAFHNSVRLPSYRVAPGEFIDSLCAVIESQGHDMLIPCSDPGLAAALEHYDRLSSLLHIGCPRPEIVRSVLDKGKTLQAAKSCGIVTPGNCALPDLRALDSQRNRLQFPIIAKPLSKEDESKHAFKMRYFATYEDLRDAFLLDPEFGVQYLLQEFCPGDGVGIEILFHQNQPLTMFQHRRLKEFPVSGGGSVTSVSEPLDSLLAEQAVALLRELKWEGVAMVEFKCDRAKGKSVLMEVNGRYWGSLPLAIGAGIDFPFYEWQLVHGRQPVIPASYPAGLRFRWLGGDIRRLGSLFDQTRSDGFPLPSKTGESLRFLKDFSGPICPAIWSWSDPKPALEDWRGALRYAVAAIVRGTIRNLKQTIAEYRYHGRRNSMVALRLRALYALGLKRAYAPRNLAGVRSVLFVCHGNIIRSAMAEAMLRKYLQQSSGRPAIDVASAGLTDQPQERADSRSRAIAGEFGVSLEAHRPQRLTQELIDWADLIFIMDYFNEARMLVSFPTARHKVFYLSTLSRRRGSRNPEVPDPNLGTVDDVRHCYRALDSHVATLANALKQNSALSSETSEAFSAPGVET
ncbi:MAG TPA: ATP-grasp domain-containing protein [Acidobacteriaceae bacterium]|nr:ATP-grasp domain-containing protein [Acidobacteriaceae bacterium]